MEKQPIPQVAPPVQTMEDPQKTTGTSQSAPPFQLQAGPEQTNAPVQRENGKQEELQQQTIALSADSGISEIYLKEQFKSPSAELTADLSRLLTEIEAGKTVEDAAKELLSAVELRFIQDPDSSTLDLLGAKKSKEYRNYDFHHMSYPGNPTNNKKSLEGYPMEVAEEVEALQNKNSSLNKEKKKKKTSEERKKEIEVEIAENDAAINQLFADNPGVKKAFEDEKVSERMTRDMNKIRGERRGNSSNTDVGFMDKRTFKKKSKSDQGEIIDYLNSKMREVDGEPDKFLREEAADSFEKMRDAAAADGVDLGIQAASRSLAAAKKNAAGGNSKATASWSVHTLGLAIDLKLNTSSQKFGKETSTTPMKDVVKKRQAPAHKWVFVHGAEYGWYPLTNEPWHWEYNPSGFADKMRQELEDYQKSLKTEEEPTPEGEAPTSSE